MLAAVNAAANFFAAPALTEYSRCPCYSTGMSVFLAMAAFILMVAAPFLVMALVTAAIVYGLIGLLQGLAGRAPRRAAVGAALLVVGVCSGLILMHWVSTPPVAGERSSPHALVHDAWKQTRHRFIALKWLTDGTFEKLARDQRQGDR